MECTYIIDIRYDGGLSKKLISLYFGRRRSEIFGIQHFVVTFMNFGDLHEFIFDNHGEIISYLEFKKVS